jgi:hypothetical protein
MVFFPEGDPTQADLRKQIKALRREVRLLSQHIEAEDIPKAERYEITFSRPGALTTDESVDYLIKDYGGNLTALTMTAKTAGSGDSTLNVLVNGTASATVTLPSGDTILSQDDLMIEVEEWDRVSIQFATLGSGLADVVVHLQMVTSVDSAYN